MYYQNQLSRFAKTISPVLAVMALTTLSMLIMDAPSVAQLQIGTPGPSQNRPRSIPEPATLLGLAVVAGSLALTTTYQKKKPQGK